MKERYKIDTPEEVENKLVAFMDDNEIVIDNPKKQRVMYLWLSGNHNFTQIGELCDIAPSTVSKYLKSAEISAMIAKIQEQDGNLINQGLNYLRFKAMDTMENLLDSRVDKVRLEAAKDILDRTGHSATKKSENLTVNLSYEKMINEGKDVTTIDI